MTYLLLLRKIYRIYPVGDSMLMNFIPILSPDSSSHGHHNVHSKWIRPKGPVPRQLWLWHHKSLGKWSYNILHWNARWHLCSIHTFMGYNKGPTMVAVYFICFGLNLHQTGCNPMYPCKIGNMYNGSERECFIHMTHLQWKRLELLFVCSDWWDAFQEGILYFSIYRFK